MVKLSKQNAELVDVRDAINVMQRDAADFKPKEDFGAPYGERLEDAREVHQLYGKIDVMPLKNSRITVSI
ncbi:MULTISPECIES: hypothetical protein [Exiguobacterium]|uniref:hypothetical protein n=1 Tax=Exiguobacterium TaxID=33986 RepID=UPI0020373B9F|nr:MULTISPECIES: hypothetical protein [Exiguobacterium]MDW2885992.1 hypothetical protein [Exiguobacterium sibiricum]